MKATSLYPTEITHIDRDYRLEVELDEDEHQLRLRGPRVRDHRQRRRRRRLLPEGAFKGKTKKKEFSFEFGGVNKTEEGISMDPVVYSFDTDRIKDPLFGVPRAARLGEEEGVLQEAVQLTLLRPPCAAPRRR